MDKLRIRGGRALRGEVRVSGAKNAALPIMCASLLTAQPLRLSNVPRLMDVRTMAKLLGQMGVEVQGNDQEMILVGKEIRDPTASYDLVKTMRASVLVLGPLLARCGRARVSLPGGCAIGMRPVDQHVKGLQAMGASIEGAGGDVIRIRGVRSLHGVEHRVMPDRIETGTYLAAVAATGGKLRLTAADPRSLDATLEKLGEAGAQIDLTEDTIQIRMRERPRSVSVRTAPFPGFATDMQAQFMALAAVAQGTAVITETIFENRFMHALELQRLGADIAIEGNTAVVRGVARLQGARVMATDLRASAGLVIAGLVAEGETVIDRIYHLDRGYEAIETRLSALGARIERVR